MEATKRILGTRLSAGELIIFIRTVYISGLCGADRSYRPSEDVEVSRIKVHHPKLKWNGEPFLDYYFYIVGALSYGEFCRAVNQSNMFVFNDYTCLSAGAFDGMMRNINRRY